MQNQGSTWCGVDRPTPWWWLKANLSTLTLKNAEAAKSWRPHSPGGVTQIDALNQSPASGNINPDDTGGSTPELRPLHTFMARACFYKTLKKQNESGSIRIAQVKAHMLYIYFDV